jgi:hypothetical protein
MFVDADGIQTIYAIYHFTTEWDMHLILSAFAAKIFKL